MYKYIIVNIHITKAIEVWTGAIGKNSLKGRTGERKISTKKKARESKRERQRERMKGKRINNFFQAYIPIVFFSLHVLLPLFTQPAQYTYYIAHKHKYMLCFINYNL